MHRFLVQSLIRQRHFPPSLACLHTSPNTSALGVVEQLHDDVAIALPAGSSRRFWEVVEFRPDGKALETWKTPEVLGLHPRDVHLFTADSGLGARAMIAPRSGAILFRTEVAKAVVYADKVVLFPARRLQDTVHVAQAIKSAIIQRSALPFELKVLESLLSETASAFDKKTKRLGMVAETVMEDINRNFHASAAELQRSLPIARKLTEVQHDVKETLDAIADVANYDDQLQALCLTERAKALASPSAPPSHSPHWSKNDNDDDHDDNVKKKNTSLHNTARVSENNISSSGLVDTTTATAAAPSSRVWTQQSNAASGSGGEKVYSTQPPGARSIHMRMASRILESYEFRILGTHSALNEILEGIDQTRSVWHMQLDHQRNRVLRVNLLISIASLGGLLSTMPAAYFGMNLDSGLEDLPGMFWPMVQGSVASGILVSSMIYTYYRYGPKRRYAARLRDMRSLRDLLSYHMDDLDAIIEAVRARGRLSKPDFASVVQAAVKGKPMSKEEVALLFRVFDQNKNAVLELSELMKLEELQEGLAADNEDPIAHHTS